jgi:NAD(P)-dependent dehydrogenase (short-subunit alcohol dehydrogenase family)
MSVLPDGRPVAVVIGGTGVIGSATVRAFVRAGYDVLFSYHTRQDAAEALCASVNLPDQIVARGVSVRSADDIADAIQQAKQWRGDISTVIYASGPSLVHPYLSQIEPSDWSSVFQNDVMLFLALVKAALPVLRESKGALIAITTVATQRHAVRDILSAAPKAAIETVVRAIAKEEGRFGVRANCVAPGMIGAGAGARMLETLPDVATNNTLKTIPLARFGSPEDIAATVLFLASPSASYITGQVVAVDGGWSV